MFYPSKPEGRPNHVLRSRHRPGRHRLGLAALGALCLGYPAGPGALGQTVAEPPPARDYSTGPYTAVTEYTPDPVGDCIRWNGPGRGEPGRVQIGCYVPMIDTIISSWRCDPARGHRVEAWCAEHHEHELRHARGERHPDTP